MVNVCAPKCLRFHSDRKGRGFRTYHCDGPVANRSGRVITFWLGHPTCDCGLNRELPSGPAEDLGPAARQAPTSECVVIQARSDQAGGIRFAHAIFTPRKAAGKERFIAPNALNGYHSFGSDRNPTVDGVEPAGKQILPFVSQRTMTGRAPGVPAPIPLTPVILT